ncbi:MAG: hypothetical protein U5N85_11555 [Arcicella sp.]|nr:hypothetical protein [Arcicella sp.]
MKKVITLLALILYCNISTNAQSKVVVNPTEFIGKTILSKIEIKNKKLDAEKTELEVGAVGSKLSVGKGVLSESIWRTISFSNKNDRLMAERKVKRVLRQTASKMGISTFDSENRFERDPMATSQGTNIDPFIDKAIISEFDLKSLKFIENSSSSTNFTSIWKPKVPFLEKDEEVAGLFIYHLPEKITVGVTWTDSTETESIIEKRNFTIKEISNEKIIVQFINSKIPGNKPNESKSNNNEVKGSFGSSLYAGEMIVDSKNGFIYEMNYRLESRVKLNLMGKETRFDVDSDVTIKNEVK